MYTGVSTYPLAARNTQYFPSFGDGARGSRQEKTHHVVNAFDVARRQFGEYFDASSHAAAIKMMMAAFGPAPTDMFEQVTPSSGGYEVTQKDGSKLHITQDELSRAAQAFRFHGTDSDALKSANFAVTVLVKRKQMEEGHVRFDAALAQSVRGEYLRDCLGSLGVLGFAQPVRGSDMGEGLSVLSFGRESSVVLEGVEHYSVHRFEVDKHAKGYKLYADASSAKSPLGKAPLSEKPKDIWRGFFQGSANNCLTVAAIKAAMMRFGQRPCDVFRQVTARPYGFEVTMRDGFRLTLTREELRKAGSASDLRGDNQALGDDANFLYAASAKRALLENNRSFKRIQSFERALEELGQGEQLGYALHRLGLVAHIRESSAHELANGAIGVLDVGFHAAAVIEGAVDDYGVKSALSSPKWTDRSYRALKLI